MSEFVDSNNILEKKYKDVFKLIDRSKHIVFFTGAGISTAAQIPDFRGENGLDKAPLNIAQMGLSERDLDSKVPTLGHRAISLLIENDHRFKFVTTSNHDGLHQKSGTPWDKTANVFGVAYIEECMICHTQHIRGVITPALHRTCDIPDCQGKLKKTGVRYGQTVPVGPLRKAEEAASEADLVIVLGSSMRTSPFCDLPSLSKRFLICNKQDTPYDSEAELCVHDNVDSFMSRILLHTCPDIGDTSFEYRQKFVVKRVGDEVIITTPRFNEPAVFIEEAKLKSSPTRSFERKLNGEFVLSSDYFQESGNEIEVEFKEGFEVPSVMVSFDLGNEAREALVKIVSYE